MADVYAGIAGMTVGTDDGVIVLDLSTPEQPEWRVIAERRPRPGWNMPSRPRDDRGVDRMPRTLWEAS